MIAFSLFGRDVHRYGIFYALTFAFWYFFLLWIINKKIIRDKWFLWLDHLLSRSLDDVILWIAWWVVLWWRLWYVFFYEFDFYLQYPHKIFAIREGGMAFAGWILWVVVALIMIKYIYRLAWKEFLLLADLVVMVVPVGIMLGRIGNYLNKEIYGRTIHTFISSDIISFWTNIFLFRVYPFVDNVLRRNTHLLSFVFEGFLIFCLLVFLFFRYYYHSIQKPWLIWCSFLMSYAFVRFFLEYVRYDSSLEYIRVLTIGQWLYTIFFVVWLSLFLLFVKKK